MRDEKNQGSIHLLWSVIDPEHLSNDYRFHYLKNYLQNTILKYIASKIQLQNNDPYKQVI